MVVPYSAIEGVEWLAQSGLLIIHFARGGEATSGQKLVRKYYVGDDTPDFPGDRDLRYETFCRLAERVNPEQYGQLAYVRRTSGSASDWYKVFRPGSRKGQSQSDGAEMFGKVVAYALVPLLLGSCLMFWSCSSGGGDTYERDLREGTQKMIRGDEMTDSEKDAVENWMKWQEQQNKD